MDKWDYLQYPIIKKNVACFDIEDVSRSPGKWNWHRLRFLPFIFIFQQCAIKLLWKLKVRGYGTLLYNQIISRMTFYFKYPNSYVSMMLSSSLRLVSLIRSSSLSSIGLEKISFLHLKNLFNFPTELNRF